MRIHTDKFDERDIRIALRVVDDVTMEIAARGSRSHRKAFDVTLCGQGARHTKYSNLGNRGADTNNRAATYDDWGMFLAALYEHDHSIKAGPYRSRTDFHVQTNNKYLP